MSCAEIPYAAEQGNIPIEQGKYATQQGDLVSDTFGSRANRATLRQLRDP
jgi:hypothetical protein